MDVRVEPGGDGSVHGRAQRTGLFGLGDFDWPACHVGINLHQQRIFLRQSTTRIKFVDGDAFAREGIDDLPRAESRGFNEGAVHLVRPVRERCADQQAR